MVSGLSSFQSNDFPVLTVSVVHGVAGYMMVFPRFLPLFPDILSVPLPDTVTVQLHAVKLCS